MTGQLGAIVGAFAGGSSDPGDYSPYYRDVSRRRSGLSDAMSILRAAAAAKGTIA